MCGISGTMVEGAYRHQVNYTQTDKGERRKEGKEGKEGKGDDKFPTWVDAFIHCPAHFKVRRLQLWVIYYVNDSDLALES